MSYLFKLSKRIVASWYAAAGRSRSQHAAPTCPRRLRSSAINRVGPFLERAEYWETFGRRISQKNHNDNPGAVGDRRARDNVRHHAVARHVRCTGRGHEQLRVDAGPVSCMRIPMRESTARARCLLTGPRARRVPTTGPALEQAIPGAPTEIYMQFSVRYQPGFQLRLARMPMHCRAPVTRRTLPRLVGRQPQPFHLRHRRSRFSRGLRL